MHQGIFFNSCQSFLLHFILNLKHSIRIAQNLTFSLLNIQLSSLSLLDLLLVRLKLLVQLTTRTAELVNKLGAATNVQLRLHHAVKVTPDGLEELGVLDSLDHVVGLAETLNLMRGLEGEDTNLLVSPVFTLDVLVLRFD